MSDPSSQSGPTLHGPGGLLGTPGLRAPRKGRKWGVRLKAKQIVGNLYRGDTGQFQAGGASTPAGAKPVRGSVLSKQPKPTTRLKPTTAPAPKKGGGGKKPVGAKPKDPAVAARQAQRDQERAEDREQRQADRAQRRQDRQARIAKQQQRERDRLANDMQRAADEAKKKLEPKGGGGGGGKKTPTDDEKRAEQAKQRQQTALSTASQVGISASDLADLRTAAESGGASSLVLAKLGLLGADGQATDQGRRALSALERGDVRQYQAALQDAKSRIGREQGARDRKAQADSKRSAAATERSAKQQRQIERLKRRALSGGRLSDTQIGQLQDAGVIAADGRWKSFAVFKDHAGAHRWIARTTTAYRDRDGEIISTAALDADSQRMTTTRQFGPLRWWHVGAPDPLNAAAPWGPGLDIGDCDYSVVIGRTRVESGTFKSAEIAEKMARVADDLEMSPGFFHPDDHPGADGVFTAIRTFERSPVPIRYGRASNLFTGFTVKEHRMDATEMERRFKAMISELKLTPEAAEGLAAGLVATEKAAAGIAFKSAAATPEEITIGGVVYTLKAALEPPPEDDPAVTVETQAADDLEVTDLEVDADGAADAFIGDMTPDAFKALLAELLAPVLKIQDMVKSMGDMHGELKGMYSGQATKEAGLTAELTALKAQHQQLAIKIAQIEGDQPAVVLSADVAAALKSAGPSAPATPDDPEATEALNDPSRPFAQIAARTMPQLYRNSPDGGFAGWGTPPAT